MALEEVATTTHKRSREEVEDGGAEASPPAVESAKRIRAADFLLDILDDESGDPEIQDLADVMRSFEEEIGGVPAVEAADPGMEERQQPDLGFLFEASDDELGLPPQSSSDDGGEAEAEEVAGVDVAETAMEGFGGMWGFEDGMYDGFGFGMRSEMGGAGSVVEEGVVFDGELFDFTDAAAVPFDLQDHTWRPESLPAV